MPIGTNKQKAKEAFQIRYIMMLFTAKITLYKSNRGLREFVEGLCTAGSTGHYLVDASKLALNIPKVHGFKQSELG